MEAEVPAGGEALVLVPYAADDGDATLSLNTSVGFALRFLVGVGTAWAAGPANDCTKRSNACNTISRWNNNDENGNNNNDNYYNHDIIIVNKIMMLTTTTTTAITTTITKSLGEHSQGESGQYPESRSGIRIQMYIRMTFKSNGYFLVQI